MDIELDLFIDKNHEKIRKHYYNEAKEMGYRKKEYESYFEDCKCFTFCGTITELMSEIKCQSDYCVIAQENELVIAELFNGKTYSFI